MCTMCEGATEDEVLRRLHQQIQDHGFAIVPVGSGREARGWAYTIGLVEGTYHPELVVAGYPLGDAVVVLDEVGHRVVAGSRVSAGVGPVTYRGVPVGTVPVHPSHIRRGLMAAWRWYYDSVGRPDLGPCALQVVLPDGAFCDEHQTSQPRLDQARHVPFDGGTRQVVQVRSAQCSNRRARPSPF